MVIVQWKDLSLILHLSCLGLSSCPRLRKGLIAFLSSLIVPFYFLSKYFATINTAAEMNVHLFHHHQKCLGRLIKVVFSMETLSERKLLNNNRLWQRIFDKV